MRSSIRLSAFAVAAGVLFAGAYAAGTVLPAAGTADTGTAGTAAGSGGHAHGSAARAANPDGAAPDGAEHSHGDAVRGDGTTAQVDGYRLVADRTGLVAGRPTRVAFRLLGPDGRVVTELQPDRGWWAHVIVVRRDLTGYQHLYPEPQPDGSLVTTLALPAAGSWRAVLDVRTAGRGLVLGVDLQVAGDYRPQPVTATGVVTVDGYAVQLAVTGGTMSVRARRGGRLVPAEPVGGVPGHVVVLDPGDLAYRHAHPRADVPGSTLLASTELPPGPHAVFVEFAAGGRTRLARFVVSGS